MSSNKTKRSTLAGIAFGGHVLFIIALWFVLRESDIQEPVFEKVISARITPQAPSHLPPLNKATRDKIEKERRQNEEAAWEKQQQTLKKKYEAEAKKKKEEAAKKKLAEAKKKEEVKKKPDNTKKKIDDKKKQEKLKKEKEEAAKKAREAKKRKEKERADRLRREKMAAEAKAKAAAEKAAYAKRQQVLGKHVSSAISARIQREWDGLGFSAIQFNDPNDKVHIEIKVNRDGRLLSARVTQRAKNSNLNSKAAGLIKIISSSSYRFPPFDASYAKNTMTINYKLSAD